ncbi:MAG: hypothetical protein HON04_07975 [Planctomicrobium sp.]|nr:hypothetical protein [Planctomicrobium sp.]
MEPSESEDSGAMKWAEKIAALAADALLNAKLIEADQLNLSVEIISEEILVRLCLDDLPPDVVCEG